MSVTTRPTPGPGAHRPRQRAAPAVPPSVLRHPRAFLLVVLVSLGLAAGGTRAADPAGRVLPPGLDIQSAAAMVVDAEGEVIYAKDIHRQRPIASITKLMTAMVLLDAGLSLDEPITIIEADRDRLRWSRSRLRIDRHATLFRDQMLGVALMSSDNRAAAALARTSFPEGTPAFVAAMNRKAAEIGMTESRFADPTGLDAGNVSTAADLVKLVAAAAEYPFVRGITGAHEMVVAPYDDESILTYRNTNPLVRNPDWQVQVSKTGYIHEAGRCLVMRAEVEGRRLDIALLGAQGKLTPVGDSNRLRKWLALAPSP